MTEVSFPQLLDTVRATHDAYYKLTIVAGPSGSGKTRVLNQISRELDLPIVNLSLLLSQRLLSQTKRQRALNAEETATDLIDEHLQSGLCLDNTELLFDSTLRLNPITFFQDISRNRLIVASWNGVLDAGELRFAYADHPDFFAQAVRGYPIAMMGDEKLQLFLST